MATIRLDTRYVFRDGPDVVGTLTAGLLPSLDKTAGVYPALWIEYSPVYAEQVRKLADQLRAIADTLGGG